MTAYRRAALGVATVALLAGCTSGSASRPAAPSASSLAVPHPTLWLCRPGMPHNPCAGGLAAVAINADGTTTSQPFRPAAHPPVDCFYVYPTVSQAKTDNAPLRSTPEIVATARAQAARFAAVCRLFVPVYRQATIAALGSGKFFDASVRAIADNDIRSAWHDYLRHDNHGRGVVLIGHSQGAMTLARLIAAEVDGNPAEQHLLVSALLLGGNVTTATGKDVGGTFGHLPACRTPGQTGCVIAYSSFPATPPAFAFFGRSTGAGDQVMCTDPSRLAGGTGALHPYVPTERLSGGRGLGRGVAEPRGSTAGFATYPGYLTARCRTAAGATFLQVTAAAANGRPAFRATLGPQWGLHVYDVNIALGDLVESVRLQAATWSQAATGA